jgi:general L-amino acid transport system substrate-binding protein
MRFTRFAVVVVLLLISLSSLVTSNAQEAGAKLQEIMDRGQLNCGVSGGLPGFSVQNADTERMEGLDADFCRAVAAAIFGDPANVDTYINFVPLTANDRFTALQAGEVDVLMRNTTWTITRDASLNSDFGPTTFYDGQGLLVPVTLVDGGVASLADLEGARFCSQSGTTTEKNILDAYTAQFGAAPELVLAETSDATLRDFESGACDVLTSDKSQLAGLRSASSDPSAYVLLPDTISKEPLGPMYLDDDPQFADIVDWAVYATFTAEEFGITSANVEEMLGSDNVEIARFLGTDESALGALLGLSNDFAANVIRAVGNYGEIYDRNIVPIGIERAGTLNASWRDGGLIYAPAWR